MNDITAAFKGTDWLMSQSDFNAMVALASEDNEPRAIESERSGGQHTINVHGPIVKTHDLFSLLFGAVSAEEVIAEIQANQDADEIVLDFDTPGGEARAGVPLSEAIFNSNARIVSRVTGACASLGYWMAASTAEITAQRGTFIGSIGAQGYFDPDEENNTMRSEHAENKNTEADIQNRLNAYEELFHSAIQQGRGVSRQTIIDAYGKGMTFEASEALSRGMIDSISEDAAPSAQTTTQSTGESSVSVNNDGVITLSTEEEKNAYRERIRAEERRIVEAELEQERQEQAAEAARVQAAAEARENSILAHAIKHKRENAAQKFIDGKEENKVYAKMDAETAKAVLMDLPEDKPEPAKAKKAMAALDPEISFAGDEDFGDGESFKYGSKWNDDTHAMLLSNGMSAEKADLKCRELMQAEKSHGVDFAPAMGA